MKCPFYGHAATQAIGICASEEGDIVRRRRRCESCDRRFTTYERAELFLLTIVKRNDSHVDYDRNKVKDFMRLALRKRPISAEAIGGAIARIEEKFFSHGEKEIGSDRMGELMMCELKRLDKIGYTRFASVYRSFENLVEFRDVLNEVVVTNMRK